MFRRLRSLRKKSHIYGIIHLLTTVNTMLYMSGCLSGPREAPTLKITPEQNATLPLSIQNKFYPLKQGQERNAVINLTDIAVTSLANRNHIQEDLWPSLIDDPLDLAIKRIEDVYSDTPEAQKARSLWHDEASKDFKGEPYERTFVFLLRGARYYETGDYDNAIACFKSGILQDSLSVEGKFNADMAVFEWFIGLCHQKQGNAQAAEENFQRALLINRGLQLPSPDDNTVVLVFAGEGPRKEQTGKYKNVLLILPGNCMTTASSISSPCFGTLPIYTTASLADDFFFQATTRGGRDIDKINKYKATVKDDTKIVGTVAVLVGAAAVGTALIIAAARAGSFPPAMLVLVCVGGGLIVLGGTAHLVALAIRTKADMRRMANTPSKIFVSSSLILPGWRNLGIKGDGNSPPFKFEQAKIPYGKTNNVVYVFCN